MDEDSSGGPENYYELLGVATWAHIDEIKRAFRSKALLFHPDRLHAGPKQQHSDQTFNLLAVAYNTLSNDDLRIKYDQSLKSSKDGKGRSKLSTMPQLQGNEMWQAFEDMQKYKGHAFQMLGRLAELEKRFELPQDSLRFREGPPCTGHETACSHIIKMYHLNNNDCKLEEPQKKECKDLYICRKHINFHMCEGDSCSVDGQVCPIYALWLVETWQHTTKMDFLDFLTKTMNRETSWHLLLSSTRFPGMPYWFNTQTGESVWIEDAWQKEQALKALQERWSENKTCSTEPHIKIDKVGGLEHLHSTVIKSEEDEEKKEGRERKGEFPAAVDEQTHKSKIAGNFERLDPHVWVCKIGAVPHICTSSQCRYTRRTQNGEVACWVTGKVYAKGKQDESFELGDEYEVAPLPEEGDVALARDLKTISFTSQTTGKVLEAVVEVPYGFKLSIEQSQIQYSELDTSDKEKFEQPAKEQHPLDREKKEIQRLKKREFEFNELVRTERETSLRSAKKRKKAETKGLPPQQNNKARSGDHHQTEDTTTTTSAMTLIRGISKQIDKQEKNENGDEKDEDDEDDDVYSTEGGLYHTYTEALDFPDTAPDEEWQTLQGQCGGFEVEEEEKEEQLALDADAREHGLSIQTALEQNTRQSLTRALLQWTTTTTTATTTATTTEVTVNTQHTTTTTDAEH